jgi:molybdopterin-guanine dinucleotide biosynthesis protein A
MGGGHKALRPLAGRPVLAHVIGRLKPQVRDLVLSANDQEPFLDFCLPLVADSLPEHPGPLAGILAGLDWWAARAPEVEWVASVPADAPFLPGDLVAQLMEATALARVEMACAASNGRLHPVFGLWPVAQREALRAALAEEGVRRVQDWLMRHRHAVVSWPAKPVDPFFNLNFPADLNAAEALIAGAMAP